MLLYCCFIFKKRNTMYEKNLFSFDKIEREAQKTKIKISIKSVIFVSNYGYFQRKKEIIGVGRLPCEYL